MDIANAPSQLFGYFALISSVLFLGSNYQAQKKILLDNDGMFFQLIFTSGIWFIGFSLNWIQGFPKMYPLGTLGGVFWSTANLFLVPIIRTIGISKGILLSNTVLLVLGWSIVRFGAFHINPQVPSSPYMNFFGFTLTALSGVCFLFVKNEYMKNEKINYKKHEYLSNSKDRSNTEFLEALNPNMKKLLGTLLALFAGILYAFTFTPALYIQNNYENASKNALDYVFSLYTGIYVVSIAYFTVYCVIKQNRPDIYPKLILPGLASGLMWGIGNASFFLANNALTQVIALPITFSTISLLWSISLFKKVKNGRLLILLGFGIMLTVFGSILCAISK